MHTNIADKLVPVAKMKEPRKEHALVRLGMCMYVLGGYNGKTKSFLKNCEKYITKENKWVSIAPMNISRCAIAATALSYEKLAVCGGFDGKARLDSIELYDANVGKWTLLDQKLPLPLSNLAAFNPYSDTLVVLGGGLSTGFYMHVEMLNLKSREWTHLAPLNYGKDMRNKVIFVNNAAYASGGNNYSAEKLLIDNNKWVLLPSYDIPNNLDSWSCALTFQLPHS